MGRYGSSSWELKKNDMRNYNSINIDQMIVSNTDQYAIQNFVFFQSIITSVSFPKNTTLPNISHFINPLFINSLPSTSDTQGFSATTQSLPPFPRKPFKTPSWICYQYISLPLLKRFRLTNYFFLSTTQYNAVIVPIKSPNGLPR